MVFINLMWLVKGNSNLALVTPNVIFVYFIRSIVDDIYLHILFFCICFFRSYAKKNKQTNGDTCEDYVRVSRIHMICRPDGEK